MARNNTDRDKDARERERVTGPGLARLALGAVAAVALLAGGLASGCGGGEDAPTPAPTATATDTPTPVATPTDAPTPTSVATQVATATTTPTATATPTPVATPTTTPTPTPTATATATATATPEPTPAATPTPQPIPADSPEVHFWGDVPEDQQAMSLARVADIVEFFELRFGIGVPDLRIHIAGDAKALQEALGEAFDNQAALHQAKYTDGSIYINVVRAPGGIERRFIEAFQDHIAEGRDPGPKWLSEGAAAYAGHLFRDWAGEKRVEDALALELWAAGYDRAPLEAFEGDPPDGVSTAGSRRLAIATIAVDWLAGQAGADALVEYYRALPNSGSWEEAFESTFGLTVGDAYEGFAAHRAEVVEERWNLPGLVRGPDGQLLRGWKLLVEARYEDGLETEGDFGRLDGRFTLQLPNGGYRLSVWVECPAVFEVLGWYEESTGFTTDEREATLVVVAGEDLERIVFELTAWPDETVPECAEDES